MKTKKVVVVPYNYKWKDEFERLRVRLEKALETLIIRIEHVGSTSVEGLSAKPIIDIDVVIENYEKFEDVKAVLENLGYRHEGDLGVKDREAFGYKGMEEYMAHHLYVCPQDSDAMKKHITFRDYLRTHKEDRDRYGKIKLEAAAKFPTDIDSYIEFKGTCIAEIYKKCGL